MPLILKNKADADRAAVQLAQASTMPATREVIDQLSARVKQLQARLRQAETEKAVLSRKLCEARLEIAMRDQRDSLARESSPSSLMH